MRPQWYDLKSVPFDTMWPDDAIWFPYMLRNEPFRGYFLYRGFDHIVRHNLEKLDVEKLEKLDK